MSATCTANCGLMVGLPTFRYCDNGMAGATARVEDALAHLRAERAAVEHFYTEHVKLPFSDWGYLDDDFDRALRRWHHTVSIEVADGAWALVERVDGHVVKIERQDVQSWHDLIPVAQAAARIYGASFWEPDSQEWLRVHPAVAS